MGIVVSVVLGVLVLLAIVFFFVLASTSYIGPTEVGLVIKRAGKKLPADEPIAFSSNV